MMIIRRAQMDTFAASQRQRFVAELTAYARRTYPAAPGVDPEAAARRHVRTALVRAERLGAGSEDAVRTVLDLLLGVGEDFDDRAAPAWVRGIAGDPQLGGDEKVALLQLLYAREQAQAASLPADSSDPEFV